MRFFIVALTFGLCLLPVGSSEEGRTAAAEPATPPSLRPAGLPPGEALQQLQTQPGIQITLAASEPEVIDPISIRFDQRGRLWVVEMHDYPTGPVSGEAPGGRIRILEDAEGDGHFEQAHTFADGLLFPTGLQPWKDGAIVTLAGRIIYLADTDGDQVADLEETWFTGFAEENEQLRANHPTLGPDGLIYVAGGLRGGTIVSQDPRWPAREAPLKLSRQDFAFDPQGGVWKGVTGNSQFGLTIDDFGRRIGCSNRNPAMEAIFPAAMVDRDPLLLPTQAYQDAALVGPASSVNPIAPAWTTSNLHAGQFSAACGVLRGGGNALPAAWQDDLFICEPTGYLVQRQETVRQQGRWVARRAPLQEEFVASADPYFRPVDLAVGPDGGLYIVDMYRAVIEHPDWAPTELKERTDERFGDQQGRIWRVAVPGHQPTQVIPPDAALQPAAWADWLSHPNRWQRSIASRMLFEAAADAESRDRIAAAVTGALQDSASLPAGRARAAAFLAAVDRGDRRLRHRLLTDPDPAVRAVAVHLASSFPDADRLILQAAGDADAAVQLQAVVAIGSPEFVDRTADPATLVAALAQTAQDHPAAESFQLALGAVDQRLLQPLLMTLSAARGATAVDPSLLEHLATRIGMQVPAAIAPVLASLEQDAASRSVILGILQGARRRGTAIGTLRNTLTSAAATRLDQAFADAARTAVDSAASESRRLRALDLLAFSDRAPQTDLRSLVAFDQPPAIRVAVLPLLFGQDRDWFVAWFDREGRSLPPALRREAIAQLLRTPATSLGLLERIASGEVPISTIGLDASKRLQRAGDPEVKKRAQSIFAAAGADRQAIIDRYQPALTGPADPREGRKLFQEHCAVCHRVDGIGTDVGAEISDSRTKTHAALLTAILHPNAAIDAAYLRYTVLTVDGKVIDGLLVKENADEVTLKVQGGELVVTPRSDIEAFQTAGVSLMPEGFEQVITVDQMRDLISFLKNWRYLDGRVPVETTAGD